MDQLSTCAAEVLPFLNRKDELQVLRMDAFCVAVGLLVPPLRHEQVMKELHYTQPGITLMKALACSLVWWPKINADLERILFCLFCPPKHFCILDLGCINTMLALFLVECTGI